MLTIIIRFEDIMLSNSLKTLRAALGESLSPTSKETYLKVRTHGLTYAYQPKINGGVEYIKRLIAVKCKFENNEDSNRLQELRESISTLIYGKNHFREFRNRHIISFIRQALQSDCDVIIMGYERECLMRALLTNDCQNDFPQLTDEEINKITFYDRGYMKSKDYPSNSLMTQLLQMIIDNTEPSHNLYYFDSNATEVQNCENLRVRRHDQLICYHVNNNWEEVIINVLNHIKDIQAAQSLTSIITEFNALRQNPMR